ncbi:MAG TPA: PilZ domain-containing protein [Nitrospira sp.]|nr:PilZ domain-containing protein [Nitrospira sp.]
MDLRRHQRFPVHFHSVLSGPKLSESVGTIVNLSEGGCCVETDSQVYTGIQVALRLHVSGEESPILIEQAAVRWTRGHELGVGFITVAPPHKERLSQLLERLKRDQRA